MLKLYSGIIDAEIDMLGDSEESEEIEENTKQKSDTDSESSFSFKYQAKERSPESTFTFAYNSPRPVKKSTEIIKIATPILMRNTPFTFSSRTELTTDNENQDSLIFEDFGYEKKETFSPDSLKKSTELEISLLGDGKETIPTAEPQQYKLSYNVKMADDCKLGNTRPGALTTTPYKIELVDVEDHDSLFESMEETEAKTTEGKDEEDGLMGSWVTDIFKQYQSLTITKVEDDEGFLLKVREKISVLYHAHE